MKSKSTKINEKENKLKKKKSVAQSLCFGFFFCFLFVFNELQEETFSPHDDYDYLNDFIKLIMSILIFNHNCNAITPVTLILYYL